MNYRRVRLGVMLVTLLALAVAGCAQATQQPQLSQPTASQPTATTAPTATPSPEATATTPGEPTSEPSPAGATGAISPTLEAGMVLYQQVEVPGAGLLIEVPEGWTQEQDSVWIPEPGDERAVGVAWAEITPPQEPEAALLPKDSQTLESAEVNTALGSGRRFLMEIYGTAPEGGDQQAPVTSVEMHVLVTVTQSGVRTAYDFHAKAPTQEQLASIEGILQHIIGTVTQKTAASEPSDALRAAVAQKLGVPADQVTLSNLQSTEWPDACLGLPAEGEMCAQVVTPGYSVTAKVDGQTYEVRTNQELTRVEAIPNAVARAEAILANDLDVSADAITLVSFESVDWPDACLGIQTEGVMCAQVITPGYRVVFSVEGQRYELHTDATGQSVGIVPGS